MALSPSHRFGQIIGDLLEEAVRPPLLKVAKRHGLYLDWKHKRPARNNRKKVTWKDHLGIKHDLDYVLEKDGSETELGRPKAFIEVAYRRYTKHSRNKAQEIHGAVIPLAATYSDEHPFLGAVLAGVFTDGSLKQLKSHGFGVLFFPFDDLIAAFNKVGIHAYFDEDSSDAEVQSKVNAVDALTKAQRRIVATSLRARRRKEVAAFLSDLERTLVRKVERVMILALHGGSWEAMNVAEAIQSIFDYDEAESVSQFARYELNVHYSNGDEIRGQFENKREAVAFLSSLH